MSKTTFLGYVPSLKSKHEATIVGHKAIESKGGSIRYTLQGEYQGRKTLPKTVSKADFEGIYGFDAKEAESVIIAGKDKDGKAGIMGYVEGVEDKTGFTPEAIATGSKEDFTSYTTAINHKAESVYIKGNQDHNGVKNPQAIYHQVGMEDREGFETTKIIPIENKEDAGRIITEEMDKDERIIHNVLPKSADTVGSPSPASVEPPAPSEKPFPQEPSNENFSAFGFGKKDEEEEEEAEPKTQEFTVVLQEGDKLELTDIEEEQATPDEPKEEDSPEESEIEEKEADEDMVERTFFITDAWYDTYDETDEDSFEDQYGYKQSDEQPKFEDEDLTLTIDAYPQEGYGEISDSLVDALSNSTGFGVYHFSFVEIMPDGSKKVLEAVQAKVTRPVKEDETEEDEESEGLSTLAKVGLGVGALAVGAAIFGAEGENIPYQAETDYTEIYGAETFGAERSDDGIVYVDEDNSIRLAKGSNWMKGSGGMEEHYVEGCMSCHEELDGFRTKYVVSPSERWAYCMECFDEMKGRDDVIINDAETFEAQFVGDFNRATMNEDYWLACPNSVYSGGNNKNCKEVIRGGGYGYVCENCGEEFHETAELDAFKMAETFEAEKVYRNMPTDPDIPTILIDGPFGKEMWAFYDESNYDNGFKHDPKAYQNEDGEMCAQCEGDISLEYARSSRGYRYCSDCWEMSSFTKRGYHAETDYTEIYSATSGDGYISHDRIDTEEQRTVELRHDNPTTYYNWNSPYDVDDTEVEDAIESELGDEPGEGNYGATVEVRGSKYSQQGQKYVDVDVDMDTDYGDSRFMGLAAESKEAESKNLKMALGIAAVGIGLAAVLGKEKIKTLFDRLGL